MVDHDVAPGPLTRCQICGSSDLELVFDCGSQPLCDSLLRPADLNRPETHYPLRLFRCTVCANCQLDYIVSGSEIYYPDYPYRAGITRELTEHLQAMASDLVPKLGLSPGSRVVDIGSNDGTLLSQFKKLGMKDSESSRQISIYSRARPASRRCRPSSPRRSRVMFGRVTVRQSS
jgi:hypothetical protein